MPISVTCPVNNKSSQSGFTLLELIVVLLITGMVTALAWPALQRMGGSMQRSLELSEAELLMNGLALSVRDQGQPLLVKQLPDPNYTTAWMQQLHELNIQVQADPPVFISASGFCPFGGEIVIELKGRTYSAYLAPPACQLQWSFPDA